MLRERRIGSLFNGNVINVTTTFKHVYINNEYNYSKISTDLQYIVENTHDYRKRDIYIGIKNGPISTPKLHYIGYIRGDYDLYYNDTRVHYTNEYDIETDVYYVKLADTNITLVTNNSTTLSDDKKTLYVHKIINENVYITQLNEITVKLNNKDITSDIQTKYSYNGNLDGATLTFKYPTNTTLELKFYYEYCHYDGWNEDEGDVYDYYEYYHNENISAGTSAFKINLNHDYRDKDYVSSCYSIEITPKEYNGTQYTFGKDNTPVLYDGWV